MNEGPAPQGRVQFPAQWVGFSKLPVLESRCQQQAVRFGLEARVGQQAGQRLCKAQQVIDPLKHAADDHGNFGGAAFFDQLLG